MSSELKDPEFHARLTKVIGEEKPFAWAERVGISKGAFSRIWNEGTVPGPEHLRRIRESEGVSIDWLLTGEGPERVGSTERKMRLYREAITELKKGLSIKSKTEIEAGCSSGNKITLKEIDAFIRGKYTPNETQIIVLCRIAGGKFDSPEFIDSITKIKNQHNEKKDNIDINLLKCILDAIEEIDGEDRLLSSEQRSELASLVYYMNQETNYTKKKLVRFIEAVCVLIEQGVDFNNIPDWKMSSIIREMAQHVVKGGDE